MSKLERGCNFQPGLDPWTCATALPGILTLFVMAYGCLAWMANEPGEAKTLTLGSVKQGPVPAPTSSPAALRSVQVAAAPLPETQEAKHPAQSEKPFESVPVPPASPYAVSLDSAEQNDRPTLSLPDLAPQVVEASTSTATRDLTNTEHAREVQRRLATLGYFAGFARGTWGPLSRSALADFKAAHQLPPNDVWDWATEAVLFNGSVHRSHPFVGVWAVDAPSCAAVSGSEEPARTVIRNDHARAGASSCAFREKRAIDGVWNIKAKCTSSNERWTANITLSGTADRLTWTSERGAQEYVRCGSPTQLARVR
jgi:hypothetical protein